MFLNQEALVGENDKGNQERPTKNDISLLVLMKI